MAVRVTGSGPGSPLEWPATLDVDELIVQGWRPAPFRQFLLKIHSRCNLSCDYCYVYMAADQSWRRQPVAMSPTVLEWTVQRITEHVGAHELSAISVILHGGEPLLAGHSYLADLVRRLHETLNPLTRLHLGLQTNGILLDETFLQIFRSLNVQVGVSLDGDDIAHDRNRRYGNGRGSYSAVFRALELLRRPEYRKVYSGLLCTIDLRNDPIAVYEALLTADPPAVDFLLPHGTWSTPPPGRDPDGTHAPYAEWLIAIFDRWYGRRQCETRVRLFEEILCLILGGQSRTETIGLTPTSLIVVETDGSIEQTDALKSAYIGAPVTGMHVARDSFDAALRLPSIVARQLGVDALADECTSCSLRQVCGGGLYPHRYRPGSGFRNPSVYCPDLFRLISHICDRVHADLRPYRGVNR